MTDLFALPSRRFVRSFVSSLTLGALSLLFACGDDGTSGAGGTPVFGGSSGTGGSDSGTGGNGATGGSESQGGSSSNEGGSSGKGGSGGSSSKGGNGGSSSKGGSGGSSSKGGNGGTAGQAGNGGAAGGTSGGTGGTAGSAGSSTGGASGAASAPLWSFTRSERPYIDPSTLVTSDDRVYFASYGDPVRVTALDGAGKQVFSVDVGSAAGVDPNSPPVRAALAVAYDDTLVVVVRAFGSVVRLDAQGNVRWSAANKLGSWGNGELSAPAVAKDGTIYATQSFGEGSNYPLPRLVAISPTGDVTNIAISSDSERNGASIAPTATPPHLLPNGQVRVVVGNTSRTYTPGTLALVEEHALVDGNPYARSGALVPKPDGGFTTTAVDASMYVQGCDSQVFPTFGQAYDPAGGVSWSTALPAEELLLSPTTDKGGALLYPWGNCSDGAGSGTYRVGADGKLLHTFDLGDGDGLQSLGTSGKEILTLLQNGSIDGVEVSPVVVAADRETGAVTRSFGLVCATGDDSANEDGAFRVLPNGRLIVICAPTDSAPDASGVYAFDTAFQVPNDSTWPFTDGDIRARRSFETGTGNGGTGGSGGSGGSGGGSGGSGQAGTGGSGQAGTGGSGQAGAGGNGAAGSESGGIPTSCSQTNDGLGCCSADGNTLFYCSSGQTVLSQACAGASCGWNAAQSYYDCDTNGLEAPGASPPIACGL